MAPRTVYQKTYYEINRDEIIQKTRQYAQKNPSRVLYHAAKQRSKLANLPFNLDIDDIIIPELCPVFGTPLVRCGEDRNEAPSLDRIRPELGYIKGNVRVISQRANRMKQNMSVEDCRLILRYLEESA